MDYTMLTKVGALLKAILGVPQAKQAGLTQEMLEKVLEEINTQDK